MVIFVHLIIGNLLFILFLSKREKILGYYEKCKRILKINDTLKHSKGKVVEIVTHEAPRPQKTESGLFSYLFFYMQFVTIAWMLFLTTFIAAEVVYRLNPKIKELL